MIKLLVTTLSVLMKTQEEHGNKLKVHDRVKVWNAIIQKISACRIIE